MTELPIAPGSSPHFVRDAHYHAIAASKAWLAFRAAMLELAKLTPEELAAEERRRTDATDYHRGRLGGH